MLRIGFGLGVCHGGGPAAAAFSPYTLPELALNIDASRQTGVTSGTGAPTLTDFGPNGLHAVPPTASNRPVWSAAVSGAAGFVFDAADDYAVTPALAITTSTIVVVLRGNAGAAGAIVLEHGVNPGANPDGQYMSNTSGATSVLARGATRTVKDRAAGWAADGVEHVVGIDHDGTNAGHLFYLDSTTAASMTTTMGNNPGAASYSSAFYIGARNGGVAPFGGVLRELLVFAPRIATATLAQVLRFAGAKWNKAVS